MGCGSGVGGISDAGGIGGCSVGVGVATGWLLLNVLLSIELLCENY